MANKTLRHPDLEPRHPGALLREVVIPSLDLSVKGVAEHMRVTRQTLHRILSEKASVTPEMALRLGKFCGNGPDIWLRMQDAYDLWHAERALRRELAQIETVKAA